MRRRGKAETQSRKTFPPAMRDRSGFRGRAWGRGEGLPRWPRGGKRGWASGAVETHGHCRGGQDTAQRGEREEDYPGFSRLPPAPSVSGACPGPEGKRGLCGVEAREGPRTGAGQGEAGKGSASRQAVASQCLRSVPATPQLLNI